MKRPYREGPSSSSVKCNNSRNISYKSYNLNELHTIGSAFRFRFNRRCAQNYQLRRIYQKTKSMPSRVRLLGVESNPSLLDVGGNSCPSPMVAWRSIPANLFESFSQTSTTELSTSKPDIRSESCFDLFQNEPVAKNPHLSLETHCDPVTIIDTFFKCDFCSHTTKQSEPMKDHLSTTNHFCSSVYRSISRDISSSEPPSSTPKKSKHEDELLALSTPRALINGRFSMKKDALTVLCPTCYFPFPDPYLCSYHHQIHHDRVGRYLIVPVQHYFPSVSVATSVWPFKVMTCSTCQDCLEHATLDGKNLNKCLISHWSNSMKCSPFRIPNLQLLVDSVKNLEHLVLIATCPFCKANTYKYCSSNIRMKDLFSFVVAFHGHILMRHKSEEEGSRSVPKRVSMPHMSVISFSFSTTKSQIMAPLSPRSTSEVMKYCFKQAQILKRHLKDSMNISKKSWMKRVKDEMQLLRQIRA